jgi:hypothetical protein
VRRRLAANGVEEVVDDGIHHPGERLPLSAAVTIETAEGVFIEADGCRKRRRRYSFRVGLT